MKFKEILEKWFKNPKKFLINITVVFLLGILLLMVGDVAGGLFGIGKEEKTSEKPGKETVQNEEKVETTASQEAFPGEKDYEEKLKKELTDTLTQIKGVGKVSLMIYFEGSSESIPATNSTDTNKKTEESDKEGGKRTITETNKSSTIVTTGDSGSNKALIVKEVRPSIGGVMVIAEGAENSAVKEEMINSVKTLLALPSNKVTVSPMKKS